VGSLSSFGQVYAHTMASDQTNPPSAPPIEAKPDAQPPIRPDQDDIKKLISFFELLDRWDREANSGCEPAAPSHDEP